MSDFDREYWASTSMLYGQAPSPYLELFVRSERISPGPALDLGCGEGRNSLFLAGLGFAVTAVDSSRIAITRLMENANARGLTNLQAFAADVQSFVCSPNAYKLIVANTILDHLEQVECDALVKLIEQTLMPEGYLYVTVFTTNDPGHLKLSGRSATAQYVKRYFRPNELRGLFSGVSVIRYHEEYFLDRTHMPEHYHSVARLMARKK